MTDAKTLATLLRAIDEQQNEADPFVRASIATAVSLWIARVRFWRFEQRLERAAECARIIAGDALARPSKPGNRARVFNAVAEGLAVLACCPGGVRAYGYAWEAFPLASCGRRATPAQRGEPRSGAGH